MRRRQREFASRRYPEPGLRRLAVRSRGGRVQHPTVPTSRPSSRPPIQRGPRRGGETGASLQHTNRRSKASLSRLRARKRTGGRPIHRHDRPRDPGASRRVTTIRSVAGASHGNGTCNDDLPMKPYASTLRRLVLSLAILAALVPACSAGPDDGQGKQDKTGSTDEAVSGPTYCRVLGEKWCPPYGGSAGTCCPTRLRCEICQG